MKRLLFITALYCTLFSLTFNGALDSIGNHCRTASIVIFLVLSIVALFVFLKKKIRLTKELKILLFSLILSLFSFGYYHLLGCAYLLSDIRELLIPLLILFSSYILFDVTDEKLRHSLIVFGVVAAICSIYLIVNTGGFVVLNLYRDDVSKNQIAPFFAQIALVLLYFFLTDNRSSVKAILLLSIFCIFLLPVFIRARTSLFCILIGAIILLFWRYKLRVVLYIPFFLSALILCFGSSLFGVIQDSLFANYDTSNIDSITTGRYSRILLALKFICQNPFLGASMSYNQSVIFSDSYALVHVYILLKILRYGIIGGLPFIIAYCCVLSCCWKSYKQNHMLVFLCLFVAILTSLAEYSSPFGPGTSYVLCYVLLGRQLRISQITEHT